MTSTICPSCHEPLQWAQPCPTCGPDPLSHIFFEAESAPYAPNGGGQGSTAVPPPNPTARANVVSLDINVGTLEPAFLGPLVRPGDCFYLVGVENLGKTTLLADILSTMVDPGSSEAVDGLFRVNRNLMSAEDKILIVDGENSATNWAIILNLALRGRGLDLEDERSVWIRQQLHHVDADVFELGQAEPGLIARNAKILADFVIAEGYKALVMDPIWDVFQPRDSGDGNWVTFGLRTLVKNLRPHGVTTFVVSHPADAFKGADLRKKLAPYGSSRQRGLLDVWVGMTPNSSKNGIRLHYMKGRRSWWINKRTSVELIYGQHGGGYNADRGRDRWPHSPMATLSDRVRRIAAKLPRGADFNPTDEWCADLGMTKRTVVTALTDELMPAGLASRCGSGHRGDPFLYHLPEEV